MTEYTEENVLVRPIPYKILRQIHLSDGGSYAVQMDLKAGLDEDEAYEIIDILDQINLLYKVEGTDPQLYDVNYAQFEELWKDLWIEEIADVPVTPVHFGSFIEHYLKSFLEEESSSTIREMLVEEFFLGLNLENENRIPTDYEGLLHNLSEEFEGKKTPHHHIRHALNNKG